MKWQVMLIPGGVRTHHGNFHWTLPGGVSAWVSWFVQDPCFWNPCNISYSTSKLSDSLVVHSSKSKDQSFTFVDKHWCHTEIKTKHFGEWLAGHNMVFKSWKLSKAGGSICSWAWIIRWLVIDSILLKDVHKATKKGNPILQAWLTQIFRFGRIF